MTEKEIEKIYTAKQQFVETELKALLIRTRENIADVTYKQKYEEIVTVWFYNGASLSICVTADSLTAIVKDVIRGIEGVEGSE